MPDQMRAPGSQLHLVPTRPDHLRGRELQLDELDELLVGKSATAAVIPALTGQGGIGKTALAALYAHDRGDRFGGGVFWLTLAEPDRDAIIGQFVTFARFCHIRPGETGSTEQQFKAMAERWLGSYGNRVDVLLILDNVEQPELLSKPLPGLYNHRLRDLGCRKLITSRRDDLQSCLLLRLKSLPIEIARSVLIEAAERTKNPADGEDSVDQLLGLMGGLPLALRLAGALLANRPETTYLRLAKILRERGAREVLDDSGVGLPDYRNGLSASLGAVLAETWSALPINRPELASAIYALAQLPEGQVFPAEVLKVLVELPDDPLGLDEARLPALLRGLQSWNLIECPERDSVKLHPLIRADARQRCSTDFSSRLVRELASRLEDPKIILGLRTDQLGRIARALERLGALNSGSPLATPAIDLCRLLRIEADTLSVTADPISGMAHPAQLAYVAALHGQGALKAGAENIAGEEGAPYLRLRWTTAQVERALRHRLGHDAAALGCAISADGRTGLSASFDQTLIVWDLASGEERHRLRGRGGALNADGKIGLLISKYGELVVWDLASGQPRYRLHGHKVGVRDCAISSDGRTGLSVSFDDTLIVWDIAGGKERRRVLHGHEKNIRDCAISFDGSTGLSASEDGALVVWDLASGGQLHRLTGHQGWVQGCAISDDGRTCLSASRDRTVIVWELATGEQRYRLHGHEGRVRGCSISADGSTGLSASDDQIVIVWDLTTGKERRRLRGHQTGVVSCAINADGSTALSASDDGTVLVWDLPRGEEHHPLGHQGPISGCAMSSSGNAGFSASEDGTLIVWDLTNGKSRYCLRSHEQPVRSCAISADGSTGLSASGDTVIVWDLVRGEERRRLFGHERGVISCSISADGSTGLSVSYDGNLFVWDLVSAKERERLHGPIDTMCCAISANGTTGLSASSDGTVIVWELGSAKARHCFSGGSAPVWSLAINANGNSGLSAPAADGGVIVWDLASGEQRYRLRGHKNWVRSCAISADGSTVLSASRDGTVILWDLTTRKILCRLALASIPETVALAQHQLSLIGDCKGNVTCLELVTP